MRLLTKVFYKISTLVCIVMCMPLMSYALPDDSQKTLHIVANSTEFNYKTGVDVYEGDVKIDQGTTQVIADKVVTQKNEHHKIVSAIAYGLKNKAQYLTIPKNDDLVLKATAYVIKYYPITSIIILENDVVVTQGENSFHGPHIIYNTKEQTVSAPASKNGRATIVIEPKQLKSNS